MVPPLDPPHAPSYRPEFTTRSDPGPITHRYPAGIGREEKTSSSMDSPNTYAMTDGVLGYGVMPVWIAEAVNKLMVNSNSATASSRTRAGARGPHRT